MERCVYAHTPLPTLPLSFGSVPNADGPGFACGAVSVVGLVLVIVFVLALPQDE